MPLVALWRFASFPHGLFSFDFLARPFHFAFLRDHLVGLANQVFRVVVVQDIQAFQQDPFVAAKIGRWADSIMLAQLGKLLRRRLQA